MYPSLLKAGYLVTTNKLRPLGLLLLIFSYSLHSMALEEIVVSAARSNTGVSELPYSVITRSQDELRQQLVRNLPEALAVLPGVLVQKTANGHGSPFIRGFTGYRTLTLIDGVRYNNSVYRDGPNEYFSLIDINSLEQIELLSGPASSLYGSDAIGGTLYLKTKACDLSQTDSNSSFFKAEQSYRYASAENSHSFNTAFEIGQGNSWGVRADISRKNFGDVKAADIGVQENTGYDEDGVNLRADLVLSEQWHLTMVHQQLTQDDVWRTHSTVFAESFAGTETGSDLRRLKDQDRQLSYAKLSGESLNHWIDTGTLTISDQQWHESGDRISNDNRRTLQGFDSHMQGIDLQLTSELSFAQFVYGFDYYIDNVDSERQDFNADGSLDVIRIQGPIGDDSQHKQLGVFAQYSSDLSDNFSLLIGSRYNRIAASVGQYEDPDTGMALSFKDNWSDIVNSARGTFTVNEELSLWGGISQSFRAPNIADISRFGNSRSDEFEVAATDLSPEKFLTYELGLKSQWSDISLTASYYYTDIKDFITSTPTGLQVDGLTQVSKTNSASGFVQGVEVDVKYAWKDNIEIFGNFTWLEGELDTFANTDSLQSESAPMSRIMPATLDVGAHWTPSERSWFRVSVTHADKADKLSPGDENDTQRIPPGGTPAYTLVNLQGGYKLSSHLSLTAGINNLLDEAYRSHGSGSNEPGIGLNMGVELSL